MTDFTPWSAALGGALIGLAAVLLMATTGRIAGVSGFVSRLLPPYSDNLMPLRLAFVAGLLVAPVLYNLITGTTIATAVIAQPLALITAGLLVGIGTVAGSGCTSGHGVCGLARLSPRSLTATAIFMITAIVTVYVTRHVLGGQ